MPSNATGRQRCNMLTVASSRFCSTHLWLSQLCTAVHEVIRGSCPMRVRHVNDRFVAGLNEECSIFAGHASCSPRLNAGMACFALHGVPCRLNAQFRASGTKSSALAPQHTRIYVCCADCHFMGLMMADGSRKDGLHPVPHPVQFAWYNACPLLFTSL